MASLFSNIEEIKEVDEEMFSSGKNSSVSLKQFNDEMEGQTGEPVTRQQQPGSPGGSPVLLLQLNENSIALKEAEGEQTVGGTISQEPWKHSPSVKKDSPGLIGRDQPRFGRERTLNGRLEFRSVVLPKHDLLTKKRLNFKTTNLCFVPRELGFDKTPSRGQLSGPKVMSDRRKKVRQSDFDNSKTHSFNMSSRPNKEDLPMFSISSLLTKRSMDLGKRRKFLKERSADLPKSGQKQGAVELDLFMKTREANELYESLKGVAGNL